MISSHVAHDCLVGNNVIIANNVPLGGHVIIDGNVVIGGNSAVQQFTRIGKDGNDWRNDRCFARCDTLWSINW